MHLITLLIFFNISYRSRYIKSSMMSYLYSRIFSIFIVFIIQHSFFSIYRVYEDSVSQPITIYATYQVTETISIAAPSNMTYGNRANLAVTKVVNTSGNASYSDVTAASTYSVQKLNANKVYEAATPGTDYTLTNGVFTPNAATNYIITATQDKLTASATIVVGKGTLTIAANDGTSTVNSNRTPPVATITGMAQQDSVALIAGTDYVSNSLAFEADHNGYTTNEVGEYPITDRKSVV